MWGNGSSGAVQGAAFGTGVGVGWALQSSPRPIEVGGNDETERREGAQLILCGDGGGEGVPKPEFLWGCSCGGGEGQEHRGSSHQFSNLPSLLHARTNPAQPLRSTRDPAPLLTGIAPNPAPPAAPRR